MQLVVFAFDVDVLVAGLVVVVVDVVGFREELAVDEPPPQADTTAASAAPPMRPSALRRVSSLPMVSIRTMVADRRKARLRCGQELRKTARPKFDKLLRGTASLHCSVHVGVAELADALA